MNKIIEVKNLSKTFKDAGQRVKALSGINLTIEKGSYTAIVGPSGAGKSTLIHILGGLDYASEGKVFFEGKEIKKLGSRGTFLLRNKKVGFMFQFYHLISELTAAENIMLPFILGGGKPSKARERVQDLGRLLNISGRLNFYPSQLSGGEQQRIALARALVNEPQVLFCDEPTGNLDHGSAQDVRNLIKSLNQEKQTTLVLVTHNLELAKDAQTVLNIKDGRLI